MGFQLPGILNGVANYVQNDIVHPIQQGLSQLGNTPVGQFAQGEGNSLAQSNQNMSNLANTAARQITHQPVSNNQLQDSRKQMTQLVGLTPISGLENTAANTAKAAVGGAESIYPWAKVPNKIASLGKGMTQAVRQIRLPANLYGAQDEQAVHDTLNRLGVGGSGEQQYGLLQPTMNKIGNWIKNESSLATNPQDIPIKTVQAEIESQLQKRFLTQAPKGKAAAQAAKDSLNEIYDLARNDSESGLSTTRQPGNAALSDTPNAEPVTSVGTPGPGSTKYVRMGGVKPGQKGPPGYLKQTTIGENTQTPNFATDTPSAPYNPSSSGDIVPKTISSPDLYALKIKANQATSAIYEKIRNNNPLTDTDKAVLAGRDALDKVISQFHPDVKDATTDMSHLYDAVDSLEKARFKAPPIPDAMGAFLPPIIEKGIVPPALRDPINRGLVKGAQFAANPTALKSAALVGGGAAAALVGNKIVNGGFNNPNNGMNNAIDNAQGINSNGDPNQSDNHIDTIAQPYSKIKLGKDGTVSLQGSLLAGQRQYMSTQNYNDQLSQLGNQYTYGTPMYNQQKAVLDSKFQNEQSQAKALFQGNNAMNFMDNATNYMGDAGSVYKTLDSLQPGFWNGVGKAGSIRAYTDPRYASELQQIDNFNNEFASAYESVTGQKPSGNQLLSSANSPKQASVKYASMVQFLAGTFQKFYPAYTALTSASVPSGSSPTASTRSGPVGLAPLGQNSYSGAPGADSGTAPGMVQPGLQTFIQGLPALPSQ